MCDDIFLLTTLFSLIPLHSFGSVSNRMVALQNILRHYRTLWDFNKKKVRSSNLLLMRRCMQTLHNKVLRHLFKKKSIHIEISLFLMYSVTHTLSTKIANDFRASEMSN